MLVSVKYTVKEPIISDNKPNNLSAARNANDFSSLLMMFTFRLAVQRLFVGELKPSNIFKNL